MLRITYPKDQKKLETEYLKYFNLTELNDYLDKFYKRKELSKLKQPTAEQILTYSISQLLKLSKSITALNKRNFDDLKLIFNYDKAKNKFTSKQQPNIAKFFIDNVSSIKLHSCYYCNIDYINMFNDIADYQNGDDFYFRGTEEEFRCIEGVGEKAAKNLIAQRKKGGSFRNVLKGLALTNFEKVNVSSKYGQFTLDHVLDKANFPIASLSLYNFVPCCYNCNSKFKLSQKLVKVTSDQYLSPTSNKFNIENKIHFRLMFPLNPKLTYKDIRSVKDFVLKLKVPKNKMRYEEYINIFKLNSRYVFHKREILRLVETKKNYSEARIKEIARIAKVTPEQVRADVFGKELFTSKSGDYPLSKLKKDVAKQIGIIGVK
jgi:hypothetical protein